MLRERGIYIFTDGNRFWATWEQGGWILERCDAVNPSLRLPEDPVGFVKQKVRGILSVSDTGKIHQLAFPPDEEGRPPIFPPKLEAWFHETGLRVAPFRKPTILNTGWSVDDLRDTGENITEQNWPLASP